MHVAPCKRISGLRIIVGLALLLAASATLHAEQLPIKFYTTADGLAHDRVKCIVRDSRGFLWFCTVEGLSRFDGYRFTTYSTEHGLPSPSVNQLLETRSGVYWLATNDGVCRLNLSASARPIANGGKAPAASPTASIGRAELRFTVYPVGDQLQTNRVNVLYEDRAGRLWAGSDDGLFFLEETDSQARFRRLDFALRAQIDGPVRVGALVEDGEGSFWINTSFGLLRRLPNGQMVHYQVQPLPSFATDISQSLLKDREGRLWIKHPDGLVVFNPGPSATTTAADSLPWRVLARSMVGESSARGGNDLPVAPGEARLYLGIGGLALNEGSALYQASDGQIWISKESGGVIAFDGHTFRDYTIAQGLSGSPPVAMVEDSDGNLWIGTLGNGAMKLARNGLVSYAQADGLGHPRVVSIFEDQTGALCASSGQWFINRFDGTRFTPTRPRLPNVGWQYYEISFQDRTGEWWVPTSQGLYHFPKVSRVEQLTHTRPKAIYTTREGLTGNQISRLFEDSRGDIWIATTSDSRDRLTRWERATQTFHRYTEADGLPPFNTPTRFCVDAAGDLWIGFQEGGLARYADGRFKFLTTADGVPQGGIRGLHLDHAGRLWIATDLSGLSRIDDPGSDSLRVITYSAAEGLAGNNVRCITEDAWGRIYVGAGRGVDRLDPATGRIRHYTAADGLVNSYVNAAFRHRDGALWFGTLEGLSRLIPEPDRFQSPPPILIGGLRVAGAPYPLSELGEAEVSKLELESNQNHVQIDFFGISFAAGETLQYQFKLEGADSDWSRLTDQRTVNYASLSPGRYRFLVRAVGADGTVSPTPAVVAFRILPPIWQRWWFLTLAAMLVGLASYATYRYRVARLLELERVRTRIATDLHDDIGSSLSQISVLSEVIRKQVGREQNVSEPLTMIGTLSRDLVDALSDIVWAINPRRDRLSDLTQRMRRYASDVFAARDMEFDFDAPGPRQEISLGADLRREVFLIFKESINNMVRHSGCTRADLRFVIADGRLELSLRDNGKGFDPERGSDGNGLPNIRQRATKLGGSLEIISGNGQGTIVKLQVPLGKRVWLK